ncbi:MAG: SRPBCC family protein [Pseudomonadota bacterium]
MKRTFLVAATALSTSLFFVAASVPALAGVSCKANLMRGSIVQLSATHATIDTSVLINADPAKVWATLTDFENMARWSTGTLQNLTGDIRDDGSVTVTFIFGTDENGEPNLSEIPHTLIYEEGHAFGWSDPFPEEIGGGRDNHLYRLEPCGDQTLLIQTDEIVDNANAAVFVSQLLPMYQTFNAELKTAVESQK